MSSGAKSPEEVMAMAANDAVVTRSTSGATKNKPIMYKKKSASTASTLLTSSRNSSMTYLEPESDVFSSFIGSDITSKPSISGQSKVHFEIICSITTKDSEDKETVYKWVMRKTFSELSQFHEEVIGKFFPNILFPPKSLISIQMSERAIRNRRAALESYWKELSRSIGSTISNSRYFKGFNKFLNITDSMIQVNIQDRIQISELVLQQKARIVEDSTCVTDILNLFPSEHVVLKELRSECEKLADELDTVSRERSRLERKYNAMMGTKQTSLNRVDELKKLIQEAKASIASFDLLTQAATAEIRVAQQREVSLKEELTVTVAQLEESVNAYSEVKKIAKVQIDTNNDENGIEEPIKTRDQTGGDNGNDYDDICEEACIDESYESPEDEKLTVNNISTQIQSSEKISLESDCSDTATTTAESTPQRSEVNSSNTVTETSACDEVILSLSDTPIQLQTITTTCPSSSSKHPESETTSDGHQVGQESVETSNTNNIQSQNLVSTTSIDMLPNALNTSVKTIGVTTSSISISSSSSMKPPTKPVKPRSKPPEKLSIGGNVFGGSQELESEFVEISI